MEKSTAGRYVAGYIHTKRATMTIAQTITAAAVNSDFEYEVKPAVIARACRPVTRNTMPLVKQMKKSQKKIP